MTKRQILPLPLPDVKTRTKAIKEHWDAYKQKRKSKPKTELSEEEITRRLTRSTELLETALKTNDFKEYRRLLNKAKKIVDNNEEKKTTCGKATLSIIFYITKTIIFRIEELYKEGKLEYEDILKYSNGEVRVFEFNTCTETIQKATDTARGSFNGPSGHYATLAECGFMVDKKNFTDDGIENPNGNRVRLYINLEWIFNYSQVFAKPLYDDSRGNSTINSYLIGKSTEQSQKGEWITTQPILPTPSEASGEKTNEGQFDFVVNNFVFGQKNSAPPRAVRKMAQSRLAQLLESAYSPEMLKKGRVMLNQELVLTSLDGINQQDLELQMLNTYEAVHIDGEPWTDTDARIALAIQRKIKYMAKHPAHKIYTPLMYLSTEMQKGTLLAYCRDYLMPQEAQGEAQSDENAQNKTQNVLSIPKPQPSILFDFTAWAIEQGFDEKILMRKIRRWGHEPISDCIRFARAKIMRGYPVDCVVRYLKGIMENISHPEVIRQQADDQETLLAKGSPWGVEKPHDTQLKANKWLDKVKKFSKKTRLTHEQMTAIAQKAQERNASDNQIEFWIEAVAKRPKQA